MGGQKETGVFFGVWELPKHPAPEFTLNNVAQSLHTSGNLASDNEATIIVDE